MDEIRPVSRWRISIHAPRVGSDARRIRTVRRQQISIHAPRVGSDFEFSVPEIGNVKFLSTLPAWGATATGLTVADVGVVFLSTLPAWGATCFVHIVLFAQNYFYPRSPRGERQYLPLS